MNVAEVQTSTEGQGIDPVIEFFSRPGEEVIWELSNVWTNANKKDEIYSGKNEGLVMSVQSEDGILRYFRIEEATLYTDEETLKRWKETRGPAITEMKPGTLFAYQYRTSVLTFLKTQGAENIQLKHLSEVDEFGEPVENGLQVTTGKTGELFGLKHEQQTAIFLLEGENPSFILPKIVK